MSSDTHTTRLSLPELLLRSAGPGLVMGFLAVAATPLWFCLLGIPCSAAAGTWLLRHQLTLALPESARRAWDTDATGDTWQSADPARKHDGRATLAGAMVFLGVLGFIASIFVGAQFVSRGLDRDPSQSVLAGLVTLAFGAAYCLAVAPFAFMPVVLLDRRRSAAWGDLALTSVALATRDLRPLFVGAVVAGLSAALPVWLVSMSGSLWWWLPIFLAPWFTGAMLAHRYARLSPGIPVDVRQVPLPRLGLGLLLAAAGVSSLSFAGLALVRLGSTPLSLALLERHLVLSTVALVVSLLWGSVFWTAGRAWSRVRAIEWASRVEEASLATLSGTLELGDEATVRATERGVEVKGEVWLLAQDVRLRIPPGAHRAMRLPPMYASSQPAAAWRAGEAATVVGRFGSVAQPGFRAISPPWPAEAMLLPAGLDASRTMLARAATRRTVALLVPLVCLATCATGALMLAR